MNAITENGNRILRTGKHAMKLTPQSPTYLLFASSAKHAMDASISYRRILKNFPRALDRERYEAEARRWRDAAWASLQEARDHRHG